MFYLYDGDHFQALAFNNVAAALDKAKVFIELARDACDPEWPSWVEDIAIYEAPEGCAEPDEDGTQLYRASMTNVRDAELEADSVGFFCDYEMLPPNAPLETA